MKIWVIISACVFVIVCRGKKKKFPLTLVCETRCRPVVRLHECDTALGAILLKFFFKKEKLCDLLLKVA